MAQDVFFQETLTQGISRIQFSGGGHRGRCYYSDKIPHGLGEGTVYLTFAAMDEMGFEETPLSGTQLLFGDTAAFEESGYVSGVPLLRIGAVLYAEEGCFRIGVRLLENTSLTELKIAWRASRLDPKARPSALLPDTVLEEIPLTEDFSVPEDPAAFYITNAPRILRVEESFAFHLALPEGGGTPVWSVCENGGGTVTQNGVYTAPSVPGIFEVRAALNDQLTSVYIMVKE